MQEEKARIRKEILTKRSELSEEERQKSEVLITERILGHQWFYRSEVILCYASYGSELSTKEIITEALKAGKQVFVPKVIDSKKSIMEFFRIQSLDELEIGYKGIPEPLGDTEMYLYQPEKCQNTLLIMPGVAFDMYRNRIGYGKGFYDRFLEGKEELQYRSVGIGYACQLVDKLPCEEQDIRPYQVICL